MGRYHTLLLEASKNSLVGTPGSSQEHTKVWLLEDELSRKDIKELSCGESCGVNNSSLENRGLERSPIFLLSPDGREGPRLLLWPPPVGEGGEEDMPHLPKSDSHLRNPKLSSCGGKRKEVPQGASQDQGVSYGHGVASPLAQEIHSARNLLLVKQSAQVMAMDLLRFEGIPLST